MAVDIDKLQIEIETSSNDAAKNVRELANALEQLKKSMGGGGGGLGGVKDKIKGIGDSADRASKSFNLFKGAISGIGVRRVTSYLGSAVVAMNEYVETVNLFQVAMGGYYEEAKNYAELVNQRLGVDPAQWMRTQGVFMSMGKGFGMAEKQAYDLSEGLTELSYDIASLYNEDIESAATRLQSALAGEIEPIRRLGISISQATLQEYALSRGIRESVANMTEQEKALLRSLKLIEDAGKIGAIGDFAKTLESPANAVRVLTQQFEQLKRAIGSVFLPIVVQAIPYVQAFTSVLTDMISGLATLVGFEMPEWDSSSWESTADAVGDTTAAVKKLKQATIGIDELNIIGQNGGGAGAGGGLSDWAADIEIPDLWNKEEIEKINTKASEIKEKLKPVLEIVLQIGAAFALWKIGMAVFEGINSLKIALVALKKIVPTTLLGGNATAGLAPVVATIVFLVWRFQDLYKNSEEFRKGLHRIGEVSTAVFSEIKNVIVSTGAAIWNLLPESVRNTILTGIKKISEFTQKLNVDWKDVAAVAVGFFALLAPGGKMIGLAILGFELISHAIRLIGSISDETWENMKKTATDVWNGIKNTIVAIVGGIGRAVKDAFKGMVNFGIVLINRLIDFINDVFTFSWDDVVVGGVKLLDGGSVSLIHLDPIELFKDGGFPSTGQMFIARESGPELVGTIGQKTTVANNSQIVDGISAGVREAQSEQNALLSEQNALLRAILAKEGNFYLDGREIKRSYDKASRASGVGIMAGGVL